MSDMCRCSQKRSLTYWHKQDCRLDLWINSWKYERFCSLNIDHWALAIAFVQCSHRVQSLKFKVQSYLAKVIKREWRMPWLTEAMKDVISCDKPRLGANDPWPADFRMGQPNYLKGNYLYECKEANRGNWNILVPRGEENNSDSPSSGERPGNSLNRVCSNAYAGL